MDIKAEVEKLVQKITGDKTLLDKFKKDPAGTVKGLVGDAASNEVVNSVVTAVKAKIGTDGAAGALGAIKGLFGKK